MSNRFDRGETVQDVARKPGETAQETRSRLASAGLAGHLLDLAVRAGGPARHQERVNTAISVCVEWCLQNFWMVQEDAHCTHLHQLLLAHVLMTTDLNGIGGGFKCPGSSTTKMPWSSKLGKGRWHASDGDAWRSAQAEACFILQQGIDKEVGFDLQQRTGLPSTGYGKIGISPAGLDILAISVYDISGDLVTSFGFPIALLGEWGMELCKVAVGLRDVSPAIQYHRPYDIGGALGDWSAMADWLKDVLDERARQVVATALADSAPAQTFEELAQLLDERAIANAYGYGADDLAPATGEVQPAKLRVDA